MPFPGTCLDILALPKATALVTEIWPSRFLAGSSALKLKVSTSVKTSTIENAIAAAFIFRPALSTSVSSAGGAATDFEPAMTKAGGFVTLEWPSRA